MITINFKTEGDLQLTLDKADLKEISTAVAIKLKDHLIEPGLRRRGDSASGKRFWTQAADKLNVSSQGTTALVSCDQVGVNLIWKGGTVKPSGSISVVTGHPIVNLLIPIKDGPLYGKPLVEYRPQGKIMRLIGKQSGKPYLADCIAPPKTGRKPKGQNGEKTTRQKTKVIPLAILREQATIKPHPDVYPAMPTMEDTAKEQALKTLNLIWKMQQL